MPEVLVVEDQPMAAISTGRTLTKEGITVINAAGGPQAIELLKQRSFDLIITDLMMPGIDGVELVTWLKANPERAGIPIIVLSSRTDEFARTQIYNAGADAYLEKPLVAFELMLKVRQLLR